MPQGEIRLHEKLILKNVVSLLEQRHRALTGRETPPPERALYLSQKYLTRFLPALFRERNYRADEVESPDVIRAVEIADSLFPVPVFGVFCTDGRIPSPAVFGIPPGHGGVFKIAGAEIPGFEYDADGKFLLSPEANFASLIDQHFGKNGGSPSMSQVFDSHLGCAARGLREKKKGVVPVDGGLFADVRRKKALAKATSKYVAKEYKEKTFFPIQFSFDPHNGFGYMGLETDTALSAGVDTGFTEDVISGLVKSQHVLSTEQIADQLKKVFGEFAFDLDWTHRYQVGMLKFWEGVNELASSTDALSIIEDKVRTIYQEADETEIRQRSLLLLANSFNGYLLNQGDEYPYSTHKERVVVVEERSNGPFEIAAFLLHPQDDELISHLELTTGIIRDNRLNGNITDEFTKVYVKASEYAEAPVVVVAKGIVRETISDADWEKLAEIDWAKKQNSWDMKNPKDPNDEELREWLESQSGSIPTGITKTMFDLLRLVKSIRNNEGAKPVVSGGNRVFVAPVLVDEHRRIKYVIPLLTH